MSSIHLDHNLGPVDRLLRGSLGLRIMYQAVKKPSPFSAWQMLGGILLALPGLTGTDPILKRLGLSTRRSDENFILNMIKQAKPGYGIKPILTEQACPLHVRKKTNFSESTSLANALAIG